MVHNLSDSHRSFNGIVHYVDESVVLASRGRRIFESLDGGLSWTEVLALPVKMRALVASVNRLTRRMFRAHVYHINPVGHSLLLVFACREIFIVDRVARTVRSRSSIIGSRPLAICISDLGCFYGEYRSNQQRTPVHVWHSSDQGRSWKSVYRFHNVRHIHGVFEDPYTGWYWVTTGDEDHESAIWVTKDRFESMEQVVAGTQRCRVIDLVFTPKHVYFGSDTPLARNVIQRIQRATSRVEIVCEVTSSVFHGAAQAGMLLFSTASEPSQINPVDRAELWFSDNGERWHRFASYTKDRWSMRMFQYGQVILPAGPGAEDVVWATPFATHRDQRSVGIPRSAFMEISRESGGRSYTTEAEPGR